MSSTHTSLGEVDTAVYNRLTSDATLIAMLATPLLGDFAVFDFSAVPASQPTPYITLADAGEKPQNAFGTRGYLSSYKLHIWDAQYGGFQKSQQILARMNDLLDQQPMTLATQKSVYFLYQQALRMEDPGEKKLLHTSVEYESFTQEQ